MNWRRTTKKHSFKNRDLQCIFIKKLCWCWWSSKKKYFRSSNICWVIYAKWMCFWCKKVAMINSYVFFMWNFNRFNPIKIKPFRFTSILGFVQVMFVVFSTHLVMMWFVCLHIFSSLSRSRWTFKKLEESISCQNGSPNFWSSCWDNHSRKKKKIIQKYRRKMEWLIKLMKSFGHFVGNTELCGEEKVWIGEWLVGERNQRYEKIDTTTYGERGTLTQLFSTVSSSCASEHFNLCSCASNEWMNEWMN